VRAYRSGTAHNGLHDWYWQRLSAVVLALLIPLPFLLLICIYSGNIDQLSLLNLLDHPVTRTLHTLLIAALTIHGYVGLKGVIEDYLHCACARVVVVGGLMTIFAAISIWWLALIWGWF